MPDKINDELKRVPFNDSPGKDQRYSEYYSLFQDYKDHKLQSVRSFNKNGINRNIPGCHQTGKSPLLHLICGCRTTD